MATERSPQDPTDPPADDAVARERDELRDRLLRTAAEFENYRKRTDRERRELSEFAAADLIRELLPVVDDLDRALAAPVDPNAGVEAVTTFRNGVELIRRQLLEALRKRGVEALDVVGRDFDPEWHESVASEPANGRRDHEITGEIRKGYRLGSRLLRPAMVRVAKA